jgi:hypothetical protein
MICLPIDALPEQLVHRTKTTRSVVSAASGVGSHRISNFTNADTEGHPHASILDDPNAQQRAAQNASMFSRYRSDVHAMRAAIEHKAQEVGQAVIQRAQDVEKVRQAYGATRDAVVQGAQAAGKKLEQTYDTTRDAVVQGAQAAGRKAEQIGQAAVQGAQAAGKKLEQTYDATRDAVVQGAQAAGRKAEQIGQAVVQGAQAAEKKVEQAYDATREAVVQGAQAAGRKAEQIGQAAVQGAQAVEKKLEQAYAASREAVVQGAQALEKKTSQAMDSLEKTTLAGTLGLSRNLNSALDRVGLGAPGSREVIAPQIDKPGHPGHDLFTQTQNRLREYNAERNVAMDEGQVKQLAASLAVQAHREGLTRVDRVAQGGNPAEIWASQNNSLALMPVSVNIRAGSNTAIEQSTQ